VIALNPVAQTDLDLHLSLVRARNDSAVLAAAHAAGHALSLEAAIAEALVPDPT
jgi:hypothetical protein